MEGLNLTSDSPDVLGWGYRDENDIWQGPLTPLGMQRFNANPELSYEEANRTARGAEKMAAFLIRDAGRTA